MAESCKSSARASGKLVRSANGRQRLWLRATRVRVDVDARLAWQPQPEPPGNGRRTGSRGSGLRPWSSAASRRTRASRMTRAAQVAQRLGRQQLPVGLDDREPGELVTPVEREPREDLAAEVGRPDAVAGEPEAVVDAPAAAEDRQVRRETSIGPPQAWVSAAPELREEPLQRCGAWRPRLAVDVEALAGGGRRTPCGRRPSRARYGRPRWCGSSAAASGSRRCSRHPSSRSPRSRRERAR